LHVCTLVIIIIIIVAPENVLRGILCAARRYRRYDRAPDSDFTTAAR